MLLLHLSSGDLAYVFPQLIPRSEENVISWEMTFNLMLVVFH